MDPWPTFISAVLDRHGVADPLLAARHGVAPARFFRRAAVEGWSSPSARVRIHPLAPRSVQRSLLAVCSSSTDVAAASREAAAWLHGLRQRPPERCTVVGRHATRCTPCDGVIVHRARWLTTEDVVEVQGVPTLTAPAMLASSLGMPVHDQWARLIDVLHRGPTTTDDVLALLDRIGPLRGKGVLRQQCHDLVGRHVESIFQAEVVDEMEELGYRPDRSTLEIPTPDGVGIAIDVPLRDWLVGLEPRGDGYHRSREQRRADRRRDAAAAGTDWVLVPIDWRDWWLERDHVLDAVDAAIAAQQRRGIGAHIPPPRRSNGRSAVQRVMSRT